MLSLYNSSVNTASRHRGRKEFDDLGNLQHRCSSVMLRRATDADIDTAHAAVCSKIGEVADTRIVKRVARRNADNIQIIASTRTGEALGCFTQIMLRSSGLTALGDGNFDVLDPAPRHMATSGEEPAAIYFWAVVATGRAALGIALMSRFLQQQLYRKADLFTTPATADGARIVRALGFESLGGNLSLPLYRYQRLSNRITSTAA